MFDCWLPCEIFLLVVNTALLILCWIPPILSWRMKLVIFLAYLAPPLIWLPDWPEAVSPLAAAAGMARQFNALRASRCIDDSAAFAELSYIVLALIVLFGVALDVSRRRANPSLEEPDDEGHG